MLTFQPLQIGNMYYLLMQNCVPQQNFQETQDLTANDIGQILGRHWEIGALGRHFYVTCEIVKLLGRQLSDNGQTFGLADLCICHITQVGTYQHYFSVRKEIKNEKFCRRIKGVS